jgi:simple sugar transport system permease protein
VALVVIFQVDSGGLFLSVANISGTTTDIALVGIIAIGVAMLLISGQFDLSVGDTATFVPIVVGKLIADSHVNSVLALLCGLGLAALIGLINGLITVYLHVPSFITTLGMYFVLDGINFIITSGYSVDIQPSTMTSVLGGNVNSAIGAPFVWMIGLAVVAGFILHTTQYGGWSFASGSRYGTSARMVGVPVNRIHVTNFVVCAVLAGFSGMVALAEYGSITIGYSSNYNLLAIVASVLGGASLFGGRGSIHGAIIGSTVIGALQTGFVIIGAPSTLYTVVTGIVLILALLVNVRIEAVGRRLVMNRRPAR